MTTEASERRDWHFDSDGALDGLYVETRAVTIKNGPSAGTTKPVLDFHVGLDDETVTVWPPAVLRRHFRDELRRRGKADFEPGERIRVTPKGKRDGANGPYWDFEPTWFEHAAPKPSAAQLLDAGGDEPEAAGPPDDDGIPF